MVDVIEANHSDLLLLYTYDAPAEVSYSYFSTYFESGNCAAGPASDFFEVPFRPYVAVVDLITAEVMDKAQLIAPDQAEFVSPDDIKRLVIAANR